MELNFNTQNVDISVALKALSLYRAGEFSQATCALLEVLDNEPKNWQARLMLGACYYKTAQFASAGRCFRFVYENASDEESRKKGLEGLLATNAKLEKKIGTIPDEFGAHEERSGHVPKASWLDSD